MVGGSTDFAVKNADKHYFSQSPKLMSIVDALDMM